MMTLLLTIVCVVIFTFAVSFIFRRAINNMSRKMNEAEKK